MASDAIIKAQIERIVSGRYSEWGIGVTDDPTNRKAQLGNPLSWIQWNADSGDAARNIKRYFLQKGFKSVGRAPKSANYVYILLD